MNSLPLRTSTILVSLALALAACGGPSTPAAPASPTSSAPAPKPEPAASAGEAAKPAPKYDVDFVEAKPSPDPEALPRVSIDIPGFDQVIPGSLVSVTKVRFKVTNFDKMPEGSYVQFILDGQPYQPVTELNAKLDLSMLAPGGTLADGEHIIAAFVCRKNGESVKGVNSIAVRRFWTGKRSAGTWDPNKQPLLVLGHPYGSYKLDGTNDVLVDWYMLNAQLGQKDHSLRAVLKGPGIKEEGIQRLITDWRTHIILSAHEGEYTLHVELLDKAGDVVPGSWNSTTRKFTVSR